MVRSIWSSQTLWPSRFNSAIGSVFSKCSPPTVKRQRVALSSHTRWMTDRDTTEKIRQLMPLAATLDMRADAYTADQVAISLDWAPSLCTAGGVLHGGVIMAVADSSRGAGAMFNLPQDASGTATIESKTNFIGAVRSGGVAPPSNPMHRGGTTIVVETEGRDSPRKLVAKG